MVDFDKSDEMLKKVEKWINQLLTMGLVLMFRSLIKSEQVISCIKNELSLQNPL